MSVECRLGRILISPAPAQRLCFSCIVFMAFIFVLSGRINVSLDWRPVSWKQSTSFSAPAPDVHPVSKNARPVCYFTLPFFCYFVLVFGANMIDSI
jgi:hypothetical protein